MWFATDTCFCVNVPQVILLYLTERTQGDSRACFLVCGVAHDRHLFLCECATSYSSLSDWCVFCDMPGCLLVCVLCVSMDCVVCDRHLFLCECATSYSSLSDWCVFCDMPSCLRIVWLATDTCFCVNVPQVILLYLTGVCSVTFLAVSLCACLRIVWLTTDTCFCVNVPQVILLYLTGVCSVTCPAVSLCAFCACLRIVWLTTDTCFCVNVPQVILLCIKFEDITYHLSSERYLVSTCRVYVHQFRHDRCLSSTGFCLWAWTSVRFYCHVTLGVGHISLKYVSHC